MNTIVIKSRNARSNSMFLRLAKALKAKAKILSEDEEQDLLLLDSIEKGMKSGVACKEEVKNFFRQYGIRIN